MDEKHTIIQSAVEQAKMKFSISGSASSSSAKKGAEEGFSENSVNDSCRDLLEMNADDSRGASESPPPTPVAPSSGKSGRQYGQQPKLIRMRELHLLLFYLCRGYEGRRLSDTERSVLFHNLSKKVRHACNKKGYNTREGCKQSLMHVVLAAHAILGP